MTSVNASEPTQKISKVVGITANKLDIISQKFSLKCDYNHRNCQNISKEIIAEIKKETVITNDFLSRFLLIAYFHVSNRS